MLPPFSPTPTTDQNVGPRINHLARRMIPSTTSPNPMVAPSEVDAPTEIIEQTNDQFVDFDLKLNNQDQYDSCGGDSEGNEESQISENIVSCSA